VAKKLTPENIGASLGRLANRIDVWKRQRDELITEGERLAGVALGYVRDLRGHTDPSIGERPVRKGGRPKGMKMSEETKAKLRAAWKKRKAAQNPSTNSSQAAAADTRARVRSRAGRRPAARQSGRG
jgi:hypothetical protein